MTHSARNEYLKHVFVRYLSACGRTRSAREFAKANSLLRVRLRHDRDIKIHQDEMAQAATHDEKVKNLMGSEIFMSPVKDRKL